MWSNVILNLLSSTVSVKYFTAAWPLTNTYLGVFIQFQYTETILRNKNMGQSLFKKHSKFRWNILLWYDQTQERKFGYLYRMSAHKFILRNENMEQNLFKKYSKFQKFDEILYCGVTRFRNVKLGVFRQYQNKNYFKKEKHGPESF